MYLYIDTRQGLHERMKISKSKRSKLNLNELTEICKVRCITHTNTCSDTPIVQIP